MFVKPEEKSKKRGPKLRWRDCVEKELRNLNVG